MAKSVFKTTIVRTETKSLGISALYDAVHVEGSCITVAIRGNTTIGIKAYTGTSISVIDVENWVSANVVEDLKECTSFDGKVLYFFNKDRYSGVNLKVEDTEDNFRRVIRKLSECRR